jgi:Family of unknown function (DUF6318)
MVLTMEDRSRTRRPPGLTIASCTLAALTAVAGCTSASSGGSTPSSTTRSQTLIGSTSASPTGSPSAQPPTLPQAARQPTRPGAEAFFRYFIDVYTYTYASQDTSVMRSISDTDCKFCSSAIDGAESARAAKEHSTGGGASVLYVTAAPGDVTEGILINAIAHQDAAAVVDTHGKTIESTDPNPAVRMDAAARWINHAWQMRAVHVYPKKSS